MLEIGILFNLSIKDCMFITSITENSKGCSAANFDSNWAYSRAWGIFTIGVGWSSTSFPSIGSSFKSKREWISLSHVKFSNSAMLYSASTISLHANCNYSSMGNSTFQRFEKEMRLSNSFVASFTLDFSCSSFMAKSTLLYVGKILDILQLFHMICGLTSLSTLESTTQ